MPQLCLPLIQDLTGCLPFNQISPGVSCTSQRRCLGLSRPEAGSVLTWCHACDPLERLGEMTLVRESHRNCDLRERSAGVRQRLTSAFDAATADIFANRAAVMPTKRRSQVDGMDANLGRDGGKGQALGEGGL
jgi:hypothetical protein